jgi:hypothetical protein
MRVSFTCRKVGTWDRLFNFPSEGRHAEDFLITWYTFQWNIYKARDLRIFPKIYEPLPKIQNAEEWYDIFVNCNWVDTRWQWYSTHLHTNNTQNNTINNKTIRITNKTTQTTNLELCWPCPIFAGFTLAFALQLREKHEKKTSVRIAEGIGQGSRRD